ncbi:MAG: NUDIX domain-containing protein [archaeon]
MADFAIAVKAFIIDGGKLLIIRREPKDAHYPTAWELPGGRLEAGENPIEGLKREVREEAGIEIEVFIPFGVRHFHRDDGQAITQLTFLCKPITKNVKLSEEHTEYEWIKIEGSKSKVSKFFHDEIDNFIKLELGKHL